MVVELCVQGTPGPGLEWMDGWANGWMYVTRYYCSPSVCVCVCVYCCPFLRFARTAQGERQKGREFGLLTEYVKACTFSGYGRTRRLYLGLSGRLSCTARYRDRGQTGGGDEWMDGRVLDYTRLLVFVSGGVSASARNNAMRRC